MSKDSKATILIAPEEAGQRLDHFLAIRLNRVSRSRVQQLISAQKVLVDGAPAKPSLKLHGGETISILDEPARPPLEAIAEEIPLDIIYEDDDLAVVNKAAGMMVHAGAGATDDARNRGTLVNALLHHMKNLSGLGGELRPGIVHRLDKETSGLIVVAKNDETHRKLSAQFAAREVNKKYIALVHGWVKRDSGTINQNISRDRVRRTRMTTRLAGGRSAVTHYSVARRLDTNVGKFTLLDVKIDTGRTHQIRVHMAAQGHPVVGDIVYGAPGMIKGISGKKAPPKKHEKNNPSPAPGKLPPIVLSRNFLHSAELSFRHPRSAQHVVFNADLPPELKDLLKKIEALRAI